MDQLASLLRRGDGVGRPGIDEASAPNSEFSEKVRKWILHYTIQHLHGPKEVSYNSDELIVFCLVRDGRPYVRSFVEHYLSLGVRHIIFMDNGSTDGTIEVASEYENVTVFRSILPFKVYQMQMKQYMMERFAYNRWSLCVDIDELFDYPYSDVVGLNAFLNYLSEQSFTAVVTQMLDMFSEDPVIDAATHDKDERLKERYKFYDIANMHMHDYKTHTGICGPGNSIASDEITIYKDGVKGVVFSGNTPVLTKHALVFLDERIRPMDGNAHKVSNAKVADITCVLFHYKFTNNLYEAVRLAVERENYNKNSRKHKMYLKTLEQKPSLQLKSETSRQLKDVNELVHNQFLVVPRQYLTLVESEGYMRISQTLQDEPFKFADALFETRIQTGTRLRQADQLQQQLQQQVKKLEKRLAKKEEETKESILRQRKLQQQVRRQRQQVRQLQNIQSSKTWKLMDGLGRVRAKLLGKNVNG